MAYNNAFIPVAWTAELILNKPLQVFYRDLPVVLLRTITGLSAYEDYCPHRGLALSNGTIIDNQLHCCYHGWSFDCKDGANVSVPVKNAAIACSLKAIIVKEAYDLIWLCNDPNGTLPDLLDAKPVSKQNGTIQAKTLNSLENFMEGSHTHYVHDGLIRSKDKKRHALNATIVPNHKGFSVHYDVEPAKGLLTKLLPTKYQQLRSVNTYIHPNIAVLEFFNAQDLMISRFEAILVDKGNYTYFYTRIFLDIGMLTRILKFIPHYMFKKIIAQDKRILEMQEDNLKHFENAKFVSDTTDSVGKELAAWTYNNKGSLEHEYKFEVYW